MDIMSCLKFFWCLYAIRQSLSGIVHFCDPPRIASHTTFYQLHPCNKSTTLDKITKFYLIRKRTARAVLTGMCYSAGSAMRHGS
ncbi:hypothetical protein OSK26_24415, partial [Escherichia coli]|nr:hypothetical protein [Escherichia coli]